MSLQPNAQSLDHSHWPEDLRCLWDKALNAADLAGLISTRGYYYQCLYSLPLMNDVLAGRYTAYSVEIPEDFTAWLSDSNGKISRLAFFQIKTSGKTCFFSEGASVRRVLSNFARAAAVGALQNAAEVEFRLVCNRHPACSAACQTELAARQKPAVDRFKKDVQALFPTSSIVLRFEHYLPIPASKEDFLCELQFLKDAEPRLLEFLDSCENLSAFVRQLIGAILPYHTARSGLSLRQATALNHSVLPLRLQHDRLDVKDELRSALRSAADRVLRPEADPVPRALQAKAKERAARELKAARISTSAPGITPAISFSNREAALEALEVIHRLRGTGGCLFRPAEFRVSIHSESFWISTKQTDRTLEPLLKLLRRRSPFCTHAKRVELILSFLEGVSQWAKAGLSFDRIRANDPDHRDLYVVRRSSSASITFVLADLGILHLHDADEQILGSEWLRGAAVADAIRYLYYGTDSEQKAKRTAVYRRRWNDNIVFEIASRLDSVGLIHADMLQRELATALRDEHERWPLLFHAVDEQFVRDITDAGIGSVAEAVASVYPTRLLLDRGLRFDKVFYAFSDEAQVGLLHSPKSLSFTLYRYIPYLTRRWERARERDWGTSVALDLHNRVSGVFVSLREASDAAKTVADLFGLTESEYRNWLRKVLSEAAARLTEAILPAVLGPEAQLLQLRRRRLDLLRQIEIPFEMFADSAEPVTIGETVALSLIGDNHLASRLARLGYSFVADRIGLSIRATDSKGNRLIGVLKRCVSEPPDETVYIDVTLIDPGFSPCGRFRIADFGADAVVSSEETLLRELRFSLSTGQTETAALRAWRMLERVLGSDLLGDRRPVNLWRGETCYTEDHSEAGDVFAKATQTVSARLASDQGIHLLTGAPGTGKTHVAARIARDHLASSADHDYPPCRVLVVAASHFGIDNFLRTFLQLSKPGANIFRNVPRLRVDVLKNRRVIDAALHDRLTKALERQKSALPRPNPPPIDKFTVSDYAASLRSELEAAERIQADLKEGPSCAKIPSHEQWRQMYGINPVWPLPIEVESKKRYLRNRLQDLEEYRGIEYNSFTDDTYAGENLYLQFGCEVIATTPDAFDRLPDMTYSLVVFEEASQLAALKILKVLTKVIRACSAAPRILMSGDPQQLPPFTDSYSEAGESADPDIDVPIHEVQAEAVLVRDFRTKETPFERMCTRNPAMSLEVQHRMHPDIATLVNSLFYSAQHWTTTRSGVSGGVTWVNTHQLRPRALVEENGTSRYNLQERDVIRVLVRDWISPGRSVLVVSPYSAQVSTLISRIDRRVNVRTIDGCQGIEADVVIVSFVSFKFSETQNFVIDPRRMNVALSRARDALFLVGDLNELRMNVERLPQDHAYRHLEGLAKLFGEGGHFSDRVRDWPYGRNSDIPR